MSPANRTKKVNKFLYIQKAIMPTKLIRIEVETILVLNFHDETDELTRILQTKKKSNKRMPTESIQQTEKKIHNTCRRLVEGKYICIAIKVWHVHFILSAFYSLFLFHFFLFLSVYVTYSMLCFVHTHDCTHHTASIVTSGTLVLRLSWQLNFVKRARVCMRVV